GHPLVLVEKLGLPPLVGLLAADLGLAVLLKAFVADPVAVRLARLGEQDQRRGVGGLQREGEVQRDERIAIPRDRVRRMSCRLGSAGRRAQAGGTEGTAQAIGRAGAIRQCIAPSRCPNAPGWRGAISPSSAITEEPWRS